MKNLLIIFMALSSFGITAQNEAREKKEHRKELRENLTPEQRSELHSKKMTLDLDLTDLQQKKLKQLFLDLGKDKPTDSENKKDMTPEAKYAFKNAQMDRRIAMKREVKKILSPEQFEKWEKGASERRSHHKKGSKRYKQEGR